MPEPKRKYRDLFLGPRVAAGDKSHPVHTILKEEGFRVIPIDLIRPDPNQPRKHFDEAALGELTASIQDLGVLEPIRVRKAPDGRTFTITAGERRYRAAKAAGLKEIPAIIHEDEDPLVVAIVENLQREDLNPIEEAEGLLKLKTLKKCTDSQLAKSVGKSRQSINDALLLNQLPEHIRDECRTSGTATKSQLLQILRAGSPQKMTAAWESLKRGETSTVRALRAQSRPKGAGRPKHYRFDFTPDHRKFQVTVTFRKTKASAREVRDALKAATKHAR